MAGTHLYLRYHLVWSTKSRLPMIDSRWASELYAYLSGILKSKKVKILKSGGTANHIHLLVSSPSTLAVADLVEALKSNSSRWIHQNHAPKPLFSWQEGYGAFTISRSQEEKVSKYIMSQSIHHSRKSFENEYLTLLKKHEVEYDKERLWD